MSNIDQLVKRAAVKHAYSAGWGVPYYGAGGGNSRWWNTPYGSGASFNPREMAMLPGYAQMGNAMGRHAGTEADIFGEMGPAQYLANNPVFDEARQGQNQQLAFLNQREDRFMPKWQQAATTPGGTVSRMLSHQQEEQQARTQLQEHRDAIAKLRKERADALAAGNTAQQNVNLGPARNRMVAGAVGWKPATWWAEATGAGDADITAFNKAQGDMKGIDARYEQDMRQHEEAMRQAQARLDTVSKNRSELENRAGGIEHEFLSGAHGAEQNKQNMMLSGAQNQANVANLGTNMVARRINPNDPGVKAGIKAPTMPKPQTGALPVPKPLSPTFKTGEVTVNNLHAHTLDMLAIASARNLAQKIASIQLGTMRQEGIDKVVDAMRTRSRAVQLHPRIGEAPKAPTAPRKPSPLDSLMGANRRIGGGLGGKE